MKNRPNCLRNHTLLMIGAQCGLELMNLGLRKIKKRREKLSWNHLMELTVKDVIVKVIRKP